MSEAPVPRKISVIVPARNEELHIARVVGQFTQSPAPVDFEIIVANDGSTDRTAEIATAHGAKVVPVHNPMHTIGRVRNEGARAASGEVLVFCDADTRLSDVGDLFRYVRHAFRDPRTVGGMPRIEVFPEERHLPDTIFHSVYNWIIRISFYTLKPFGSGQCQIVRAVPFRRLGGYNEYQVHGEDSWLFGELRKLGRIRFLSHLSVYESPRRYRKVGYVRLITIALLSLLTQRATRRNLLSQWGRVD
jgi:glycosyltransferase involved in cell wall biosynthesis